MKALMPDPAIRIMPETPVALKSSVSRLILAHYRSYTALDIALEAKMVILHGANGAGKTNILEALSLLCQGRGLRRADLRDCALEGGPGSWSVSVELEHENGAVQLGTGFDPTDAASRKCRIDRAPVSSVAAFADYVRVVWLTPAMDGIFTGPASDRRRFLDRLVLSVDSGHGTRVNALDRALRNRNRLLEDNYADRVWLDAAEREVAELGIAVASARRETVARLVTLILQERDEASPFPWADLELSSEMDSLLQENPAVIAEEKYREILRNARARDAAAGRTLTGAHISDLIVHHGPKQMLASRASTGEQKALLTGLVLAHARLVSVMSGLAPLILLDEIAAHFDPVRRSALFDQLEICGAQVWMTGADRASFDALEGRAAFLNVINSRVEREK